MKRDVFISYSWKDKDFALRLARDLRAVGLKVWIDDWEMKVGDSLNRKVTEGITKSAWLCVVLSPEAVSSPWVEKELNAGLARELESRDVFVLPLLYRDCAIPLFLQDKLFADFRKSYKDGLDSLLPRFESSVDPMILAELLSGDEYRIQCTLIRIPVSARSTYVTALRQNVSGSSSVDQNARLTALFVLRDKNLLGELLHAAMDMNASVRRHAIFLLGRARLKQGLSVVTERLEDPSPDVRATARDVYRQLTGRKC